MIKLTDYQRTILLAWELGHVQRRLSHPNHLSRRSHVHMYLWFMGTRNVSPTVRDLLRKGVLFEPLSYKSGDKAFLRHGPDYDKISA
jgi:hypothetical protein